MTWVKICGTTNLEDALVAVEAGADAVGFVFYEKSPRKIGVEAARLIVEKLPENVEKVGVFVHDTEPDWVDVVMAAGLTAVQHHLPFEKRPSSGGEKAVGLNLFRKPLKSYTALPVGQFLGDPDRINGLAEDFAHLRDQASGHPIPDGIFDTFFLDSGGTQAPGGTGKTFDWSKAVPIAEGMRRGGLKLVVAGGLTPSNVGEAMGILKPWGVDVASGVEARPRKKDPEKVRAFVRAVREMDRKTS